MSIYTATLTLILVMDPIGNIPFFISELKGLQPKRQNLIILREVFIAFVILIIFLFFGGHILRGLNITGPALYLAGGIILFLITLQMIFPPDKQRKKDEHPGEPLIVPLAVPLTAGPSALATVLLFATQEPNKMPQWFLAVVIAAVIFLVIQLCARYLLRLLGSRGLIAMERLMGMLLTTVAVQMFLEGIRLYLKTF